MRLIAGVRWTDEDIISPTRDPRTDNEPYLATCILTRNFTPPPVSPGNPCIAATYITNLQLLSFTGLQDLAEVKNSVEGEWLPKIAIEWDVSKDMLAYAFMATSNCNGGLNSTFSV